MLPLLGLAAAIDMEAAAVMAEVGILPGRHQGHGSKKCDAWGPQEENCH